MEQIGRFVSRKSVHVGLSEFLKHVVTLIKLFRQFISQKYLMELSSVPTLKSPLKMKLS